MSKHMQKSFYFRLSPCWCSRRTGLTCGAEKQPTPRYRHQVCPALPISYRANDVGIGPTFSLSILECRPVSFLNMQFSPDDDENHIQERLYVLLYWQGDMDWF